MKGGRTIPEYTDVKENPAVPLEAKRNYAKNNPQEKQEKPTLLVEYNQPKPPKPKQPAVNPYSFTKN